MGVSESICQVHVAREQYGDDSEDADAWRDAWRDADDGHAADDGDAYNDGHAAYGHADGHASDELPAGSITASSVTPHRVGYQRLGRLGCAVRHYQLLSQTGL